METHANATETTSFASKSTSKLSSTGGSSSTNPPHPHKEPDTCCICLEDVQVDTSTSSRMTCCGKTTHNHCTDRFFASSLSREQKGKCAHCQVKLASTAEEQFELTRGWADKGKAWAQTNVGNMYVIGAGVEQSDQKAIEYLTMAVKKGDPNAMFSLAFMHYQGQGVTKSFKIATELYAQAANQGHASAQYFLGAAFFNGNEGVGQSDELAREWWIKAAVQDHETALQMLQLLDKGEGRTTPTILCCSTCGKPKTPLRPLYPCKLCHTVQYCDRNCQAKHWKEGKHQRACKKLRKAAEKKKSPPPLQGKEEEEHGTNEEEEVEANADTNKTATSTSTTPVTTSTSLPPLHVPRHDDGENIDTTTFTCFPSTLLAVLGVVVAAGVMQCYTWA